MMPPFMPPPPALCEHCTRPIVACDADKRGCGTTPAPDAAPISELRDADSGKYVPKKHNETWRDRPPLL